MNKKNIISCLMALLFTTSINNNYVTNSEIKIYDNLYELGSTRTPKRLDAVGEEENVVTNNLVSDVKVQVTTLEDNQTRDIRFVAAIDSVNYEEVGFEITCGEQTITQPVTKAYVGLQTGENTSQSASELFGTSYTYLIAFEIQDVPASTYGYQYSAVAYVKSSETTTKSTTPKKVTVSEMAYEDMIAAASKKFQLTQANPHAVDHMTLGWSTNDTNIFKEDENGNAFEFTKNIYIYFTLNDENNTRLYYDTGVNCWQNGADSEVGGIIVNISDRNLQQLDYKKIEIIINNNGELNYGYVEFNQLPTLTNVELNDDYVLTFDTLENAASYTVKIYNDSYESDVMSFTPGNTLVTANLEVGTYSVDITAVGKFGYSNSVTTLKDVITIEDTHEIINATDYFDIQLVHSGENWESIINFKAIDSSYKVTGTQKVSNFEVYKGDTKITAAAIVAWGGAPGAYDYEGANGYHSLSFNIHEFHAANTTYTVKFLLTVDTGSTYQIEFSYLVGESATGEYPVDINSYTKNHFVILLNNSFNSLNSEDFDADIWTSISTKHEEALTIINNSTSTNNDANNAVIAFEEYVSPYIEVQIPLSSAEASSGNASLAIDGNYNNPSRWESDHQNDGQYIIVNFGKLYKLSRLTIYWEAANAESYNLLVSNDNGESWETIYEFTGKEGGNRIDEITFDTLIEANSIKIECINRNLTYGYSIFEIDAYGYSSSSEA